MALGRLLIVIVLNLATVVSLESQLVAVVVDTLAEHAVLFLKAPPADGQVCPSIYKSAEVGHFGVASVGLTLPHVPWEGRYCRGIVAVVVNPSYIPVHVLLHFVALLVPSHTAFDV